MCVTKLCVRKRRRAEEGDEEETRMGGADLKTRTPHNFVANKQTEEQIQTKVPLMDRRR